MIPFIACGGILIALSLAYAFQFHLVDANGGPDPTRAPAFVRNMNTIGTKAFELFPAVLARFITFGMDVSGIAAGSLAVALTINFIKQSTEPAHAANATAK